MALILLLSDLHLVAPSASPDLGVHKVKLVPNDHRFTEFEAIRNTLARLAERLANEGRIIDAIVMTGDAADKNAEAGYQAFVDLLKALGSSCPPASQIVVVPGNHDVTRGLLPGDPARYNHFVKHMRGAGFVTPLLDGVDSGTPTGRETAKHVLRVADIEIVPINTSEYSQIELDIGIDTVTWESTLAAVEASAGPEARAALERLRSADAARVSPAQLNDVRAMLTELRASDGAKPSASAQQSPMRIAVLHHQLLPVSIGEEVKSFETFTNLGLLRQFLRANDVAAVVHGHKHTAHTYVDYVVAYEGSQAEVPREVRVIAGPAPHERTLDAADICRLLDVNPNEGLIRMESVALVPPGHASEVGTIQVLSATRPTAATVAHTPGVRVVDGRNVREVYARLVPLVQRDGVGGEMENVICRMETAPSIETIAELYPGFAPTEHKYDRPFADDERADTPKAQLEQFKELVDWWQQPALIEPNDPPSFTHGDRIVRYDGHLDQLGTVAIALATKHETSRGIVVLLSPSADRIDELSVPFPSFCLVQFSVRFEEPKQTPYLDCIAYFRKQEVRYWWLVNVAELTSLQGELAKRLKARKVEGENGLHAIVPGRVTTVAARVLADRTPPKVQVPKVDQYYRVSRDRLLDMVHAVVWEGMPKRQRLASEWYRVLLDLLPPQTRGPDDVPVAVPGVRYLGAAVRRHIQDASGNERGDLQELAKLLEDLLSLNERYALEQRTMRVSDEGHEEWRALVTTLIEKILEHTVNRMHGPAATQIADSPQSAATDPTADGGQSISVPKTRARSPSVRKEEATGTEAVASRRSGSRALPKASTRRNSSGKKRSTKKRSTKKPRRKTT